MIARWWYHPARWWQFWWPMSGLPGGVVSGTLFSLTVGYFWTWP